MKIALDVQPMLSRNKTGIGYYTEQIIRSLLKNTTLDYVLNFFSMRDTEHKFQKLQDLMQPPCFPQNGNITLSHNKYISHSAHKLIHSFAPLPYRMFHNNNADIYHFFNFIVPTFVPNKVVLTVHDLVFRDYPETVNKRTLFFLRKNFKKSLKRADAIVTISEFTKERLQHYYNVTAPITVIPCGVDLERFTPIHKRQVPSLESIMQKYNIQRDYLLYIGTIEPRKNLERLINAYVLFTKEHPNPPQLVLGGGNGWRNENIYSAIPSTGENVIITGYLDEDEIPILMRGAVAFCFPSIYEGFGMPILEAMACGTPVLAANEASLPEVAGDSAFLVNPFDVKDIAYGLSQICKHGDYFAQKGLARAQQFSWDKSALKLQELYSIILDTNAQ